MFKKRTFRKKKVDVRRRPVERLSHMPQQISTKVEIGKKRGKAPKYFTQESKFIPYSSAMSVASIPSQKSVYASKRKGATSLNDTILSLVLAQQRLPRQIYKDTESSAINEKYEALLKAEREKNQSIIDDAKTEKSDMMSRYIREQIENIPEKPQVVRTGEGFYDEDEIDPISHRPKEEGLIPSLRQQDDRKQEELLNKMNILNEKMEQYQSANEKINQELQDSMIDRTKDQQNKTERMIDNLRDDVKKMIEKNRAFKEQTKPVEEQLINVIKLDERATQTEQDTREKGTQFKIDRGEIGTDPLSEKELKEIKEKDKMDNPDYKTYIEMVNDVKSLKTEINDLEKTRDTFTKFLSNLAKVQRLSPQNVNGMITRLENRFSGLGLNKYKFNTSAKQLSPEQTKQFQMNVLPILGEKLTPIRNQINLKEQTLNNTNEGLEFYREMYGFEKKVKI